MSPRRDLAAGVYAILEFFLKAERLRIHYRVSLRASTLVAFRYHLPSSFTWPRPIADLRLTSLSQLRIIMSGGQIAEHCKRR